MSIDLHIWKGPTWASAARRQARQAIHISKGGTYNQGGLADAHAGRIIAVLRRGERDARLPLSAAAVKGGLREEDADIIYNIVLKHAFDLYTAAKKDFMMHHDTLRNQLGLAVEESDDDALDGLL